MNKAEQTIRKIRINALRGAIEFCKIPFIGFVSDRNDRNKATITTEEIVANAVHALLVEARACYGIEATEVLSPGELEKFKPRYTQMPKASVYAENSKAVKITPGEDKTAAECAPCEKEECACAEEVETGSCADSPWSMPDSPNPVAHGKVTVPNAIPGSPIAVHPDDLAASKAANAEAAGKSLLAELTEFVIRELKIELSDTKHGDITEDSNIHNDLHADSYDLEVLLMQVEEKYKIEIKEYNISATKYATVRDLVQMIYGYVQNADRSE